MQWLNEPTSWEADGTVIRATADPQTDFWRHTRHNFLADNGHFYHQAVRGDFTAQVKVTGQYATLYDQAGLMIRLNETTWMKCGIEYVETVQYASAVVTREYSDWSVLPLSPSPEAIWFRVQRFGGTLEVYYGLDAEGFTMIRQAYLTDAETLQVGLMCAAPKGGGFLTTFEDFRLQGG